VRTKSSVVGIVGTSQPFNQDFLVGLSAKLPLGSDTHELGGISLIVVGNKTNPREPPPIVFTTDLNSFKSELLMSLVKNGVDGLPKPIFDLGTRGINQFFPFTTSKNSFEKDGRWWIKQDLTNSNEVIGILLVGAPIAEIRTQATLVVLLGMGLGAIVFLISLSMVGDIANSITRPLQYLKDRAFELSTQKKALAPLEGLDGEWLELGEMFETAMANSRQNEKSLRSQLKKQTTEFEERVRTASESNLQLDALNRQIAQQSKQLTEVSKQINFANRQSVFLQRKLDTILQVSTEGFLLLDQYGNVISANPVFLNWLGATEGEIAGRLCFDLVQKPGEPRRNFHEGRAFAEHGGDQHALINLFYPEGVIYNQQKNTAIEVLAHLQPIEGEDASVQGYVMVLRDKSLRSEIARVRNEIVAMLSDSIRIPLMEAQSEWRRILGTLPHEIQPTAGQALVELSKHYEDLLSVVDNLLMIYGNFVPPPKVVRDQIVVNRLVADCLEEVSPMARERQLSLDYKSVTGLPNLTASREAIHGIIIQLLEKMISITGPGGRVRVETNAKHQEMKIGVLSSGPALAEHEIATMFAGFIEGKHARDEYGSRLSMYLARNNVERLGGKIWAESDRGTAIYFSVPLT
jgi:signal transduction histidine kinase